MKIFLIFLSFICLSRNANGQDTIFVTRHQFETPVKNVLEAEGEVYIKTIDGLYKFSDPGWEKQKITFQKPYVFFNEKLYESDFIPKSELFEVGSMRDLIPQRGLFSATAARKGNKLFVSAGSSLFEYEIRPHYTRSHHNRSIRDIYLENGLKVISTYSGIFVNDSLMLTLPPYSNGPMTKINNRYFLSWDELSEFFPPDSMALISTGSSLFAGKSRKIHSWNGELYSLNTKSVSKVVANFDLNPILQNGEFLDLESFGSKGLLISTDSGDLLLWDGEQIDSLAKVPDRIRDIYVLGNQIFLASDVGVYTLEQLNSNSLNKLYEIQNSVALQLDELGNLWIASENGLFVVDKEYSEDPFLIIPNVEFNREAIFLDREILYVGAVDGLYEVNTLEMKKQHIPLIASTLPNLKIYSNLWFWVVLAGIPITIVAINLVFKYRRKSDTTPISPSKKELSLQDFKRAILDGNLLTVEAIAENFETNAVQLNRIFKSFGTTPGKFLKQVKLEKAEELISKGIPLEEVSMMIGYSQPLLKKELARK